MKKLVYRKSKIVGGVVDDIVETLAELKDKMTWLDGNLYTSNMLVFVKEKQAIYIIKEVNV